MPRVIALMTYLPLIRNNASCVDNVEGILIFLSQSCGEYNFSRLSKFDGVAQKVDQNLTQFGFIRHEPEPDWKTR